MNWSSELSECRVAECLTATRETKQRQRGKEHKEAKRQRDEMWGEVKAYVLAFVWNWAEVGFRYKSNGAFYTFFFFFFFWISARIVCFGRYGRFKPESARFRANRPESEPRRRESAKSTWNPRGTTRPDTRVAASPARRRVGLGCGTSGVASVLPRWPLRLRGFVEPPLKEDLMYLNIWFI